MSHFESCVLCLGVGTRVPSDLPGQLTLPHTERVTCDLCGGSGRLEVGDNRQERDLLNQGRVIKL